MNELSRILIRAKKDIYRYLSGSNVSRFLGHGYDFAELGEYRYGDDIRNISWIRSAQQREIYVKKKHEEKDLSIVCLTLVDGRMVVGNKFETLLQVVASIGYLAYYQKNLFTGFYTANEQLHMISPSKSIHATQHYLVELERHNLLGTSVSYQEAITQLMRGLPQKSLVVIVGDFLDEVELSSLSYRHDTVAIAVRAKEEEQPRIQSNVQLIDPTTLQSSNKLLTQRAIKHYQKRLHEHDMKLTEHFASHRIRHTTIYSPDEIIEKFSELFV
ncbi:MAG: DUF58 domain-containing protein [Campylobacterales bacterium]|nr:DUF58 domain-containing protein [Campylobacterales bacterium]